MVMRFQSSQGKGCAKVVVEAGNLTPNPFPNGKGNRTRTDLLPNNQLLTGTKSRIFLSTKVQGLALPKEV
jgi:hypothetical protein